MSVFLHCKLTADEARATQHGTEVDLGHNMRPCVLEHVGERSRLQDQKWYVRSTECQLNFTLDVTLKTGHIMGASVHVADAKNHIHFVTSTAAFMHPYILTACCSIL